MKKKQTRWMILTLALVAIFMLGCGASGGEETVIPTEQTGSTDFPVKDPSEPFAADEKGTVTLTNDQAYDIQVQRADGNALLVLSFKKSGVIDPSVDFTVQTIAFEIPEDMAEKYVLVGERALELHAAADQGYGFALRPALKIHFADNEIAAAAEAGGAVDPLKGNLLVLYKEQRSPKWVPQTSVGVDEESKVVTVSNIAGSGAWMLVTKKAQ